MKLRLLLLPLFFAGSAAPFLRAQETPPAAAPMHHDEDETELGGKMDKMNGAFKKLKKQVDDSSKNEDSLKLVATMRSYAVEASKLEPAKKADVPADKQADFVAAYQKKMTQTIAEIDKISDALKAGQNDVAAKLIADLNDMEKDGHKQFRRPPPKKS